MRILTICLIVRYCYRSYK